MSKYILIICIVIEGFFLVNHKVDVGKELHTTIAAPANSIEVQFSPNG